MIEGGTFQSLVEERGIMAVPTVFSNGEDLASGRLNLDQILDMVAGPRGAEDFSNIEPFDVLIIGEDQQELPPPYTPLEKEFAQGSSPTNLADK